MQIWLNLSRFDTGTFNNKSWTDYIKIRYWNSMQLHWFSSYHMRMDRRTEGNTCNVSNADWGWGGEISHIRPERPWGPSSLP
jgi:hypothetical protein